MEAASPMPGDEWGVSKSEEIHDSRPCGISGPKAPPSKDVAKVAKRRSLSVLTKVQLPGGGGG